MNDRISGTNEILMRQAEMTADTYLAAAINAVEARIGTGAVAAYPQIVATFMLTAAIDYSSSVIARAIENSAEPRGD